MATPSIEASSSHLVLEEEEERKEEEEEEEEEKGSEGIVDLTDSSDEFEVFNQPPSPESVSEEMWYPEEASEKFDGADRGSTRERCIGEVYSN